MYLHNSIQGKLYYALDKNFESFERKRPCIKLTNKRARLKKLFFSKIISKIEIGLCTLQISVARSARIFELFFTIFMDCTSIVELKATFQEILNGVSKSP